MAVFPDMHVDADHVDNSFCFDFTTGVENNYKFDAGVFPNPVENVLNIKAGDEINRIRISNMNGIKLLEQNHCEHGVNVANLLPGMYFLTVELMNGELFNGHFIKN